MKLVGKKIRNSCPVCGKNEYTFLYSCPYEKDPIFSLKKNLYGKKLDDYSFANINFTLVTCNNCTLIYQKEIPDPSFLKLFYEDEPDPKIIGGAYYNYPLDYYTTIGSEVLMLITLFKKIPQDIHVLDFGMGWGKWLSLAKAFGCNVYGSEISSLRINYNQEHNAIKNISFDNIYKQKFDIINTDMVFEHLPNPAETLKKLSAALKPGGIIKLNVPDGKQIFHKLKKPDWSILPSNKGTLHDVFPIEHLQCYNRKSLLELGKICGLKEYIIPFWHQFSFIQLPGISNFITNWLRPFYRKFYWGAVWRNTTLFLEKKNIFEYNDVY